MAFHIAQALSQATAWVDRESVAEWAKEKEARVAASKAAAIARRLRERAAGLRMPTHAFKAPSFPNGWKMPSFDKREESQGQVTTSWQPPGWANRLRRVQVPSC